MVDPRQNDAPFLHENNRTQAATGSGSSVARRYTQAAAVVLANMDKCNQARDDDVSKEQRRE